MLAIYKKDLKNAFTGMIGWIICAFMVLTMGLYFSGTALMGSSANFGYVLYNMLFVFLVVVPLLTMRSIVEERKQKTDQLLLTSPVSIRGIVWGKYLALLTVFAIPLVIAAFCPLIMSHYGTVNFALCYSCLLAFFLMGAACIAIGLFISTLTENQIISAVLTFAVLLLLLLMNSIANLAPSSAMGSLVAFSILALLISLLLNQMTKNIPLPIAVFAIIEVALVAIYAIKPTLLEGSFVALLSQLAIFDRYSTFMNGIFDVSGIIYFISVALLFVFLTRQSFEKRRWN